MEGSGMTTTALELTPDAAQILAGSAPQDRLNIETMISHLITQFPSMSNRMPNRELYEQDFFAWTQTTAALLRAGTIQDIDWYILAEEIENTGKSERRALGSQI
jgi:hypothetical protein